MNKSQYSNADIVLNARRMGLSIAVADLSRGGEPDGAELTAATLLELIGGPRQLPGAADFCASNNVDKIPDFNVYADKIVLGDRVFAGIGHGGALPSGMFHISAAAQDGNDHIIYNPSSSRAPRIAAAKQLVVRFTQVSPLRDYCLPRLLRR